MAGAAIESPPTLLDHSKQFKGVFNAGHLNQASSSLTLLNNSGLPSGIDPLELAYLYIFESVKIGTETAQIQAKSLQYNAVQQNRLIDLEAQQNFVVLHHSDLFTQRIVVGPNAPTAPQWKSKKVAATKLNNLNWQNMEISAIRGVLEDQINGLRQGAQIEETQDNTVINDAQQSIQQGGSLMQMLISLTNQISRI